MNRGQRDHHDDVPGRIPESLIHAALDGEVSEDMQREIAEALKYDKVRNQELIDTADAIGALRSDIPTPDFSGAVLATLDRQNRFVPASWQRLVRNGRMGIAAALLLSLICVAGLQRIYPRLSTIGHQNTPVRDVAQAVGAETNRVQTSIRDEVRVVRATMVPSVPTVRTPGRTGYSFSVSVDEQSGGAGLYSGEFHAMPISGGYMVYMPSSHPHSAAHRGRGGVVSSASWTRGWSMSGMLVGDEGSVDQASDPAQESKTLELP